MKLLTVTVPCYNSQDYMEKCVRSLLAGGERVQIVIIDDGSKDNTGSIADSLREKYPSIITVVHQENGGHGEGINQGLKHAEGKYFKVVDSDDWVSGDFVNFLNKLEKFDRDGGVDLIVTNYYYEHADGKGNRSINYSNALPEGKVMSWKDTGSFKLHQLLTIHSCTFRTELMREKTRELPKHVFYEDNLMVYQVLPHVEKLVYINTDLYRYFIGREGQSVQRDVMTRRYEHQLIVTERCFEACHLSEVKDSKLRAYLDHELFMMFGISVLYARLNKSEAADRRLEQMWEKCRSFDEKQTAKYRNGVLRFACIPGKAGQNICDAVYSFANKVVRFN